jgi:hypothetical protein
MIQARAFKCFHEAVLEPLEVASGEEERAALAAFSTDGHGWFRTTLQIGHFVRLGMHRGMHRTSTPGHS